MNIKEEINVIKGCIQRMAQGHAEDEKEAWKYLDVIEKEFAVLNIALRKALKGNECGFCPYYKTIKHGHYKCVNNTVEIPCPIETVINIVINKARVEQNRRKICQ